MLKPVEIYTDKIDKNIKELKETLEENHIRYIVHDMKDKPLSVVELRNLLKHFNLKHFIEDNGNGSRKLLEKAEVSPRQEIMEKLAENNKLLKKPIIVAGRLTTVGFNWDTLKQILYLAEDSAEIYSPN